ncbi:hypothetical protein EYV94_07455 [Puteibacter caeruleilacunae]|nr:hypothetical protein EYV94_07455 [Puteibacter caeruleilacunae]
MEKSLRLVFFALLVTTSVFSQTLWDITENGSGDNSESFWETAIPIIVAHNAGDSTPLDGFVVTSNAAYSCWRDISTCYYSRGGGLFLRSSVITITNHIYILSEEV